MGRMGRETPGTGEHMQTDKTTARKWSLTAVRIPLLLLLGLLAMLVVGFAVLG